MSYDSRLVGMISFASQFSFPLKNYSINYSFVFYSSVVDNISAALQFFIRMMFVTYFTFN